MNIKQYLNRRNVLFVLFCALAFIMAYLSIKTLYYSSSNREYYSHIVLIPLVSMYLLYQDWRDIFKDGQGEHAPRYDWKMGVPLLLGGVLLFLGGQFSVVQLNQNDVTSVIALSGVVFIHGAFILCYGVQAFKAALFPLLFLIFMIPIPSAVMDSIIYALQVGSTEFTNVLLMASGVPFLREGFVFHLPSISVEVAKQCSGIRSCLALLITATVAGHLFLKTGWKKVVLALAAIPIAMFKNGIRIVSLTLLGAYVDPRILQSDLHREGGIPFFIVALLLLAPVLYFLRKSEGPGVRGKKQGEKSGFPPAWNDKVRSRPE
jgi:exosortase